MYRVLFLQLAIIHTLLFCICTTPLYAATYYFDPVHNEVGEGQVNEVAVLVNTNGEYINAFEGAVVIPDTVSVVDVKTNDSVVDLWLSAPALTDGRITFSGIVPGGFDGIRSAYGDERKSGILLRIVYKGEHVGSESFMFEDMKAYLHDGKATEAEVDLVPAVVDVVRGGIKREETEKKDTVKPEVFEPYIVQDNALADSAYVVVFHTSDRGSGVAYYEVSETSTGEKKWVRANSPFVLKYQTCSNDVYVKAVDYAGNERVVQAVCGEDGRIVQAFSVLPKWFWYVAALLFVLLLFVYIRRSRTG